MPWEGGGGIFLLTAYLGGLISFLSPCIFPVLPVYLSILSQNGSQSLLRTSLFLLGLFVTFLVLGFGVGLIGAWFYHPVLRIAGGVLLLFLGLVQAEHLRFTFLDRTKRWFSLDAQGQSLLTPFVLGLTFSLGWTPCVGPVLASILVVAGTTGMMSLSFFILFAYMLGLATPFLLFAFLSERWILRSRMIQPHLGTLKRIGGYCIIVIGILLLFDQLNWLIV